MLYLDKLIRAENYMIINNLKNLLDASEMSAYALAKSAGLSANNIKEIADNESVVPRQKALEGICRVLKVNVDSVFKYEPNRVNARSNRNLNKSRLKQNYTTNEQYNIMDVMKRNEEREMMIY